MRQKNTLAIYGCGGMGINACTKIIDIPTSATGFPDAVFTLIDTSQSNLNSDLNGMNKYLIPGLDGSGKDRSYTHRLATPHINQILNDYQPKDFNIVIFSLSGGSGSILGPLLVNELLKRDLDVIVFCVGSTDSGIEADNSLKSIATLQGISRTIHKPISARIYMNSDNYPRTDVDKQIEHDIRGLALLLSGINEELDNEDIHNFLYFSNLKNVAVPAQLVDLLVYSKKEEESVPENLTAIAVASLLPSYSDSRLNLGQPYSCAGYMPRGLTEASAAGFKPLHFILTTSLLGDRIKQLKETVESFEQTKKALSTSVTSIAVSGECSDGGFFL